MSKILIITDNLPSQINGVVTTYTNIEKCANLDGDTVDYIHPGRFLYIDCPKYNEIKLAVPHKLSKMINIIDPDYIHIATEGPLGLYARIYLSYRNIKYNTAYHTKFPEGLKKLVGIPEFITWKYVRWFHKHAGRVLTTTDSMVKELKDNGFTGDILSWTRGVDRTIFSPLLRNKSPKDPITLLCVSRVSKEKNLEQFLNLDYPNSKKIMVGDGPMLEEYKRLYPDVEFTGFKTGIDLAQYYANADVFVFPSTWETFGIVMIEAMACGTPVAAFPTNGPLDVIDQGTTGYMDVDLLSAINRCLQIDRNTVAKGSMRWSWQNAWKIFRANLVSAR
jgi:glycosyltransferase involved in cell wall biosynthesis